MRSLKRIWQTALCEWGSAIRSRRALVILLLYLASAVLCMNGTISVLGKMESELATVLQLPASEETGVVSESLWKSKMFKQMVSKAVGNSLVFEDISKRHPVELLYAWFVFLCAPLLVVLVSGTRVSDDLRTGAVRYMLVRVTRLEWSLGKYFGQALMIVCALAVSALDGLTLVVPRGSVMGLVGANGAGKTTWMMMVAGFLRPTSGEINVLGRGPFAAETHAGRFAILPQDSELPPEATPAGLLYRFEWPEQVRPVAATRLQLLRGGKLRAERWGEFFDGLMALYAKLPYGSHEYGERKNEFNYQRPLCAVLAAHGFRYDPEVTQTMGRSDLVAEHPCGLLPA